LLLLGCTISFACHSVGCFKNCGGALARFH
jgi:hypothetical protein